MSSLTTIISTVAWVPRGAAKEYPDQYEIPADEMEDLITKQAQLRVSDEQLIDGAEEKEDKNEMEDEKDDAPEEPSQDPADQLLKELNMDTYDEEEEGATLFLGGKSLATFENNKEDPYIAVPDEEDDESDLEDMRIRPTDAVLLVGRTEEESSLLEFYVYDEEQGSLFVHHDFNLPSFPLCLQWLSCNPTSSTSSSSSSTSSGNFVAVGTFQPVIEIWNLDVLDVLEPCASLGGRDESTRKEPPAEALSSKKKKGKKKKDEFSEEAKRALLGDFKPGSHTDSVMSLSWHPAHASRLASGSADKTIKLWDVQTQQCSQTIQRHKDKVQAIQFNPVEPNILLSGSYDRTVAIGDVRSPQNFQSVNVDGDIEAIRWNPSQPFMFLASTEKGTVTYHDARNLSKSLFTLEAHNKPTSSLSFSSKAPIFATGSLDKTVKIWEITSDMKPSLICQKDLAIGQIFCLNFDVDSPFVLAAGGNKGKVAIWDTMENPEIVKRFDPSNAAKASSSPSSSSSFSSSVAASQSKPAVNPEMKKAKQKMKNKKGKKPAEEKED